MRPWSAERAGVDDAAFGDDVARRRHRGEVLPRALDLPPAALGAVAVHQHRVLVDGVGELGVRLELLHRRVVVAHPVLTEADELADARRVGDLVAQRAQQAERFAFTVVGVGVGGVHEALEEAVGVAAGEPGDLLLDVGGSGPATAPRPSSARGRRSCVTASPRRACRACRRCAAPGVRARASGDPRRRGGAGRARRRRPCGTGRTRRCASAASCAWAPDHRVIRASARARSVLRPLAAFPDDDARGRTAVAAPARTIRVPGVALGRT